MHSYCAYPRAFQSYRWYKPPLTLLLAGLFTFLPLVAVGVALGLLGYAMPSTSGYDSFDVYTAPGAIYTLGLIALFLPALWLAAKLRRDRPFSSYSSVRGGWDFRLFLRCLLLATVTQALLNVVLALLFSERVSGVRFTPAGFVLCLVLGPLQCIAEEYGYRGILMQTFGAWFRLPVIAIALSAAVFASHHPYDAWGVLEIFLSGLCFGVAAELTGGLEAGSALHIANNMSAFLIAGAGYDVIHTATSPIDVLFSVLVNGGYLALLWLGKKRGWYDRVQRDDPELYNRWYAERLERKNAKKKAETP